MRNPSDSPAQHSPHRCPRLPAMEDDQPSIAEEGAGMVASYTGFGIRETPFFPASRAFGVGNDQFTQPLRQYREMGLAAIAEPFVGLTADGSVVPGLYSRQPTGISTEPIRSAANAFIDSLSSEQRASAMFNLE